MFSRLNNKVLAVLLLVLAVVFYFAVFSDSSDHSYNDEVINVDTVNVSVIKFSSLNNPPFELIKKDNKWFVKEGQVEVESDESRVKALLSQMSPLRSTRVAGKTGSNSKKYGLDSLVTNIEFFDKNSKKLASLHLGKIDYVIPETDESTPYVRGNRGTMIGYASSGDDNTVYVVDGYLKISYGGDSKNFRNKTIIKCDKNNIKQVEIKSGGAKFNLQLKDNKWFVDDAQADSATTAKYVNILAHTTGYDFAKSNVINGLKPVGTLTIKQNSDADIVVDAYPVDSVTMVLVSSQNKNNLVKDSKHRIFDRLFKEKNYFLKKD